MKLQLFVPEGVCALDEVREKELAALLPPGMKKTKARIIVLALMQQAEEPLPALEIYTRLLKEGESANLSTVYRILETFVEHGLLTKTCYSDDPTAFYAFARKDEAEMNSVVCLSCKKRFFLKGAVLDEKSLERKMDGFHITAHKMELYGYCKDCASKHPEA